MFQVDVSNHPGQPAKADLISNPSLLKTHWGRATHICVSEIIIIGSDNGLSPGRRQAIIWTNVGISLIGPLGINFSDILIEINTFSFKKVHLKMSSAKWRLFRLGLNVLNNFLGEPAPRDIVLEFANENIYFFCHLPSKLNKCFVFICFDRKWLTMLFNTIVIKLFIIMYPRYAYRLL